MAELKLKVPIRPDTVLILNVGEEVVAQRHRAGILGLGVILLI